MEIKLDKYNLIARALPVYIAIAPVILLIAAISPDGLQLPLGGAATLVFVPISFLFGQIGADFGKHLEKKLWASWGGPPTTRFLRHESFEFNAVTRDRVHTKLREFGLHVPTNDDQNADPYAADLHYEACTEEIIRRTRDKEKFPLVFKGLVEYGFRRNLLGLKSIGLSLSIVGLIGSTWSIYVYWPVGGKPLAIAAVASLIITGLLFTWLLWITERTVRLTANRYARFLIETVLDKE